MQLISSFSSLGALVLAATVQAAATPKAAKNPCLVDGKEQSGLLTPIAGEHLRSGVEHPIIFCSEHKFKSSSKRLEIKLALKGQNGGYIVADDLKPIRFHKDDGTDISYYSSNFTIPSNPAQIPSSTKYVLQAEETYSEIQLDGIDLFNISSTPVQVYVAGRL